MLTSLGWRVEDLPDLEFDTEQFAGTVDPPNARNCSLVAHGASMLADMVENKIRAGKSSDFTLILDCLFASLIG